MHPNGWAGMDYWVKVADQDRPALRDWRLMQMKQERAGFTKAQKEQLSFYARIAGCLRERGIACVVLVPPFHEEVVKQIQSLPECVAAYRQWRHYLDAIFPNVVDLSSSSYGVATNFYKSDPLHFRSEIAVQMLNTEVIPVALRILGQKTNGVAAFAK